MDVPINYWAVLVGAVSNMVIGAIWYGPLFGKPWAHMIGMTQADMEKAKSRGMGKNYAVMFIGSLLMSYTLAHALVFASNFLDAYGVSAGLMAGFWNWLGFIAPVTVGVVLWENKPWKLWMINAGYYLVALCVMGVILAVWA